MNDNKYMRVKKITILIALGLLAAGFVGWTLGRTSTTRFDDAEKPSSSEPTATSNTHGPEVKSIVSYKLPDGWKEATCENAEGSIFVVPRGAGEVDCNATPSSPVKISVDSANITDCNQLQSVQNVSKHVCISQFIHGKKSIKSETRYNTESSYQRDTTIHAYYINTGKGVIKVEYTYTDENAYQAGWEELARSVKVKS